MHASRGGSSGSGSALDHPHATGLPPAGLRHQQQRARASCLLPSAFVQPGESLLSSSASFFLLSWAAALHFLFPFSALLLAGYHYTFASILRSFIVRPRDFLYFLAQSWLLQLWIWSSSRAASAHPACEQCGFFFLRMHIGYMVKRSARARAARGGYSALL